MTRKRFSMFKVTMLIALIITLNLIGLSYGYWQDSLLNKLMANIGYIELSLEEKPKAESDGFKILNAKLEDDEGKEIEVTGRIEGSETEALFQLDYTVKNNGSLPVEFDKDEFQDNIDLIEGFTFLSGPEGRIDPGESSDETIIISVNATKLDYTEADDPGPDDLESDGTEEAAYTVLGYYKLDIPLPYNFSSWSEELSIIGSIEIIQYNSDFTKILAPMPVMTSMPVQGEIVAGGLPEGPSDEELYGEGGTTEEADDPETVEGDSEQASEGDDGEEGPGDEELYDTGGTTEEADEPEDVEDDNEPASDSEGEEEESGNQEQADVGEAAEEADEPEDVEDNSEPASDSEGEEEGSGDQEQADAGEATEEDDEPEDVEDNSEPASAGDDEGESSDDQVQIDAGEGN